MGQGLEPLTADLCLSSRSQPPQLPSRTKFFEQSKNVFKVAAKSITTAAAPQQQKQQLSLLLLSLRSKSGRRKSLNTTKLTGTKNWSSQEPCQLTTACNIRPQAQDTRFILLSMLPGNFYLWKAIKKLLTAPFPLQLFSIFF